MIIYYRVIKFPDFIIADKSASHDEIAKTISKNKIQKVISFEETSIGFDTEQGNYFIYEWKDYDIFSRENRYLDEKENFFDGEIGKLSTTGKLLIKNYVGHIKFMNQRFNVYSEKMDFKEVYNLANYIDKKVSRLSMKLNIYNETKAIFEKNYLKEKNKYNSYIYIYNLLNSGELKKQIKIVFANPHISFMKSMDSFNLLRGDEITPEVMNELFSGNTEYTINKNDKKISSKFKDYIPVGANYYNDEFTMDNNENQFILFFLKLCKKMMLKFINEILKIKNDTYFIEKVEKLINELQLLINHRMFKDISDFTYLNNKSTVLTKRKGYNKILKYYIELNNNPVSVDSFDDYIELFQNKSIDKLYEYYAFFKIDDILSNIYQIDENERNSFVIKDEFNVSLDESRNGIMLEYKSDILPTVHLMFQKSYYPNKETYSTILKPDFSLKVINDETSLYHFDTKFRNIVKEIRGRNTRMNSVIKDMHAYKDGIYKSKGAYILYPTNKETKFYFKKNSENNDSDGVGYISFRIGENKKDFINYIYKILDLSSN